MGRKKNRHNRSQERLPNEQREREMSGPRPQEAMPKLLEGSDTRELKAEPQAYSIHAPQESGDAYQEARLQPQETLSGQIIDKSDQKIKLVEKMSIINCDAKKSVLIICPKKDCRAISSNIFEATEHFMSNHTKPHTNNLKKCYLTMNVMLEQECTLDWNSFEYDCIVCEQRFKKKIKLRQHYSKTSHYLSKLDISPISKDQKEIFVCPYCSDSRWFGTLMRLINHQKKHHKDRPEGVNKFTLFLVSKVNNTKRKREDLDCGCAAIEHNKKSRTSEMEEGSMECDEKDDNKLRHIRIKEEKVSDSEVYGEMISDVNVKVENVSDVQDHKDMVPEIKVKIEMTSNVKVYDKMIPNIKVKEEIISDIEEYTEMIPEPDIKIKKEMVQDN